MEQCLLPQKTCFDLFRLRCSRLFRLTLVITYIQFSLTYPLSETVQDYDTQPQVSETKKIQKDRNETVFSSANVSFDALRFS